MLCSMLLRKNAVLKPIYNPPIKSLAMLVVVAFGILFNLSSVAADVERGERLSETCLGCHGVEGYFNVYPTYRVPTLWGQHDAYLVAALQAYKKGDRAHPTMQSQASNLTDQDMADIAAYFSSHSQDPR